MTHLRRGGGQPVEGNDTIQADTTGCESGGPKGGIKYCNLMYDPYIPTGLL